MRMRCLRVIALLAVVLALILPAPRVASAHALLLRAAPAPDVLVHAAPTRIHLWFSEDLNGSASRIVVWDRYRHVMNAGNAALVPGRPRELEVTLKPLPPGSYLVLWTSVSADDGHVLRGSYLFSVKVRGPGPSLSGVQSSGSNQGFPDLAGLLAVLAHWLELLAAVTWVGSAAFSARIFSTVAGRLDRSVVASEARRLRLWLRLSLCALVIASAVVLLLQAYSLAQGDWSSALSTATFGSIFDEQYGRVWLVRQLLALLVLAMTFGGLKAAVAPTRDAREIAMGERGSFSLDASLPVFLGLIYLYLLAASGHAASADIGAIGGSHILTAAIVVDWLHVLGAALWFGGQIYVALVLIPAVRAAQDLQRNTPSFLDALNRFSPVAYASVALFTLSGPFNGVIHIPSWYAFFNSVYGRTLIIKVALIGLMMLTSAGQVYVLRPRIRRLLGGERPDRSAALQRSMNRLFAWLRIEPLLGCGVLLATSVLFYYPVPATLAAPTAQWRQVGLPGVTVHFLALGHTHRALGFAGTEQGVYRMRPNGGWQRVLSAQAVWSIDLLADDRTILAGDDAGDVYVSRDAGHHWHGARVTSQGVYAVTAQPGDPRRLLAGAGEGIYLSRDGGLHWQRQLSLPESAVATFTWQPGNSRVVFAGAVAGDVAGSTEVYVSHDAGMTWHVFGSDLQSGGGIMSLAATPARRIFAGTMGRAVWSTSLVGGRWHRAGTGMSPTNDHGAGLATVPGHPGTLFVGTLGQGVFRTNDGGKHWSAISTGLSAARDATIVLSVAYSPLQDALYAGTTDGIYRLAPMGLSSPRPAG